MTHPYLDGPEEPEAPALLLTSPQWALTQVDLKHQKLGPLKEHALTMRRLVSEAAALKAEITTLERRLPPSKIGRAHV